MTCPKCKKDQSSVMDSRKNKEATIVRRRHECDNCMHRYSTYETYAPFNTKVKTSDSEAALISALKGIKKALIRVRAVEIMEELA